MRCYIAGHYQRQAFVSQWRHMLRMDRAAWNLTLPGFLRRLANLSAACPSGAEGVRCRVRRINAAYRKNHRVILYPQAFFMSPRAVHVCCARPRRTAQPTLFSRAASPSGLGDSWTPPPARLTA